MAKSIMIQGTASNAGKSLLTAALCRIFMQDGYRTAPFKAQNMALNSYITAQGLEMGRAQVMQAEAAGLAPDVRMNPVLLKPVSDSGSQVIINGKPIGNRSAVDYYKEKHMLRPFVEQAYESLAAEYDIIVIEGAGSPAEINLKQDDFVNMGMAKIANAPVLLVGDIDRGGVFASLYGTIMLLEPDERDRICGMIINKFRGDVEILRPGLQMLEERVSKRVLGVVPYTPLDIDDEDSLSDRLQSNDTAEQIKIVVPRLPHLSNFTDFNVFSRMDGVGVCYVTRPEELENADFIILPGTKNTMMDLLWLRQSGLEARIMQCAAQEIPVFGVCGGYQMMGQSMEDPFHTEAGGKMQGMGLLPIRTIFEPDKVTTQVTGTVLQSANLFKTLSNISFTGYEIHMGQSEIADGGRPLTQILRKGEQITEGCQQGNCYGTYVHGIFDVPEIAEAVIKALLARRGLDAQAVQSCNTEEYKQTQYDKLADIVRKSLDMQQIYRILEGNG